MRSQWKISSKPFIKRSLVGNTFVFTFLYVFAFVRCTLSILMWILRKYKLWVRLFWQDKLYLVARQLRETLKPTRKLMMPRRQKIKLMSRRQLMMPIRKLMMLMLMHKPFQINRKLFLKQLLRSKSKLKSSKK